MQVGEASPGSGRETKASLIANGAAPDERDPTMWFEATLTARRSEHHVKVTLRGAEGNEGLTEHRKVLMLPQPNLRWI